MFTYFYSTVRIDNRLGFFQRSCDLSRDEVRVVAVKEPRLITHNLHHIKVLFFFLESLLIWKACWSANRSVILRVDWSIHDRSISWIQWLVFFLFHWFCMFLHSRGHPLLLPRRWASIRMRWKVWCYLLQNYGLHVSNWGMPLGLLRLQDRWDRSPRTLAEPVKNVFPFPSWPLCQYLLVSHCVSLQIGLSFLEENFAISLLCKCEHLFQ